MIEKENLLEILKQTKTAINQGDTLRLKELSNRTIHSASIHQDTDSITIAVIIYSISKILERPNFREYPGWEKFFKALRKSIEKSIKHIKEKRENEFRKEMKKIRRNITKIGGNFKKHIQDVFNKASINKASRIYEHGISMQQTSKLLGINLWELAQYAGQTGISDTNLSITLPVKKRIKTAMEIFE
jgi:hypothetical protein